MAASSQDTEKNQNTGGYVGQVKSNIGLDDFLNNFGAATSSAASSLSSRDWGNHNNSINFGGGTSLNIKQVLLWGGVALLGWYIIRKIRGK